MSPRITSAEMALGHQALSRALAAVGLHLAPAKLTEALEKLEQAGFRIVRAGR